MMVDFPLHWLAPSVFERGWQGVPAMRRVLPAEADLDGLKV